MDTDADLIKNLHIITNPKKKKKVWQKMYSFMDCATLAVPHMPVI